MSILFNRKKRARVTSTIERLMGTVFLESAMPNTLDLDEGDEGYGHFYLVDFASIGYDSLGQLALIRDGEIRITNTPRNALRIEYLPRDPQRDDEDGGASSASEGRRKKVKSIIQSKLHISVPEPKKEAEEDVNVRLDGLSEVVAPKEYERYKTVMEFISSRVKEKRLGYHHSPPTMKHVTLILEAMSISGREIRNLICNNGLIDAFRIFPTKHMGSGEYRVGIEFTIS